MPSDGHFAFRVLVGNVPLPEYTHEGSYYVESNLWTPFSYQQEVAEYVNGEKEVQKFPVTPYQLLLRLGRHCETSAFFIYVDGILVTKVLLEKGETKLIRGFQDRGGTKEFLFALPRFARNETDRLEPSRKEEIGCITVVRKGGKFVKEEYRPIRDTQFCQANKKDAITVTSGSYTMSTTKKGRYLNRTRPYDVKLKKLWQIDEELGRTTVHYRMGHTLEEMGIQVKPIDWTKQSSSRTSSVGSESSEAAEGSPSSLCSDTQSSHSLTTNVDIIKQQPLEDEDHVCTEMQVDTPIIQS